MMEDPSMKDQIVDEILAAIMEKMDDALAQRGGEGFEEKPDLDVDVLASGEPELVAESPVADDEDENDPLAKFKSKKMMG